jgi:hypothetical protein
MKFISVVFVSAVLLAARSFADTPAAEVQALKNYVGKWDCTIAGNTTGKGSATTQWVMDGNFVQQDWTLDPDPGLRPKLRGLNLMTYDAAKHTYRAWQFLPNGTATEAVGVWNAETQTFTWTARDANTGSTTVTKASFAKEGVESWSIVTKNRDGQDIMTVSGTNTRKKE